MDKLWVAASIGIPFMIIGILCVLYAHRFGKWWALFAYKNKLVPPFYRYPNMNREESEKKYFDTWHWRGFWLFWLWGIRIMGAMLAIAGAIALIVVLLNL